MSNNKDAYSQEYVSFLRSPHMKPFAQLLKGHLEDNGIPQKKLADEIEVSDATVSLWVCGARLPPIENLRSIGDMFELQTDVMGAWVVAWLFQKDMRDLANFLESVTANPSSYNDVDIVDYILGWYQNMHDDSNSAMD